MNEQWWGWILSSIGLIGFWLAGKKIWWAWYVNIANQLVWLLYAVLTAQIGFLVGVAFYTVIFARNAVKWTREHNLEKRNARLPKSIGIINEIHEDEDGLHINWTARPRNSESIGMEHPLAPLDEFSSSNPRMPGKYPRGGELREHVTKTPFGDAHVVTVHRHDFKFIASFFYPQAWAGYNWYYKWQCWCGKEVRIDIKDFWKEDQNETT